jgi:hypothetical protein
MKNLIPLILFMLLTVIALSACDKSLFDSGHETNREIVINDAFTKLDFQNIFDVTMVQDTVNKVIITCGENLQNKVSATVSNGTLTLDHNEKYSWSRKYKHIQAEIHIVSIPAISIHAPISLTSIDTLKGETFWLLDYGKFSDINVTLNVKACDVYMTSDNFGIFKIKGKCETADLWGWGSALVRADSLVSKQCHVKHRGFNDVYVNATEQLTVSLEYTGNIYYTGNPKTITIEQKLSSGSLIPLSQ